MSDSRATEKPVFQGKQDEEILVVPREKIVTSDVNGIQKINFSEYENIVRESGTFIWRSYAETDPAYKQIIPYLVFKHEDKYFLMQRRSTASEARLQNKYSLGIGGHIRKEDITQSSIIEWAKREFEEEIDYKGNLEIEPVGLLNDEADFVGKVHIGFVFLLKGDSDQIQVRSELKSGELYTQEECKKFYPNMESWSQYVFNYLSASTDLKTDQTKSAELAS